MDLAFKDHSVIIDFDPEDSVAQRANVNARLLPLLEIGKAIETMPIDPPMVRLRGRLSLDIGIDYVRAELTDAYESRRMIETLESI